jgi:hypothetical protein
VTTTSIVDLHFRKTVRQIIYSDLHDTLLGCGGSVSGATSFLTLGIVFRVAFGLLGLG